MIVTESCENESSDDHENRLNEVGPDDSRKTTGHSEETSNCLKPTKTTNSVVNVMWQDAIPFLHPPPQM
jgi:hypothetical protein